LLVHHFATDYVDRMQKPISAISEEFIAALARHSWPGNVRELQNFIERSVILSTGPVLNGSLPLPGNPVSDGPPSPQLSDPVTLEQAERSHILRALLQSQGVIGGRNGAAASLGLPRTTLISKMRRLGIHPGQSTPAPARAVA
jgi:formate hydrogenlyase transcriptional activator